MDECSSKRAAALGALELVKRLEPGVVGVGTGSTVAEFIDIASETLSGSVVLASSIDTELRLRDAGIRVSSQTGGLKPDVYIDGADEVDPWGRLVKGGGGALLGEKILAYNSRVNIIIVDEGKLVEMLGSRKPVPIEVVPHALGYVIDRLDDWGYNPRPRMSGGKAGPVVSDWGGIIVDLHMGPIEDPEGLDIRLKTVPGIVETGIFHGIVDYLVVGYTECKWRVYQVGRKPTDRLFDRQVH
ncbi:MAG: ribose-5-phosphate isomerase RpiA [Desulfurococcales archaeon]|nr:ribose-5-phosphate isomerase RpiA [Desulfurococcales archaeon]